MVIDGIRKWASDTGEIEFVLVNADLFRTSRVIMTFDRISDDEEVERVDVADVDEALDLDGGGEASRFEGLPILNGENWGRDVVGVVTGMRLENDAIICTGKISSTSMAATIDAGQMPAVSLGYSRGSEEIESRKGNLPIVRVRKWDPVEISFLPRPLADPSGDGSGARDVILHTQSHELGVIYRGDQ